FLAIPCYDEAHHNLDNNDWRESGHPKVILWEVGGVKDPRIISLGPFVPPAGSICRNGAPHESHVSYSHDFRTLCLPNENSNTLVLYEMATGRVRRTLQGHSDGITGVAFDPGGREIVSVSYDNTALVWDLTNRKHRSSLPPNASLDSHWAD